MLLPLYVDIPHLPSPITIDSNTSSIMVSWLQTHFTPDSYKISYSCQLLCNLFVQHPTVSANRASSSHIISADPGSDCVVSITAVFGSITSNTVTNTTITLSAGMYNTSVYNSNVLYTVSALCSSYCCSCRTH